MKAHPPQEELGLGGVLLPIFSKGDAAETILQSAG
jgi:hypothetical protein